jgi:hypothetical protein
MPREIELGNGYGYFCNIHDMESQNQKQKQIFDQININNYRRYLEEIERHDHPSTDFNDTLCSCSLFAFIITACLYLL